MNGLTLLNERRDDSVDSLKLSWRHGKTLSGFAPGHLILFLGEFCFIKVPLQFTALALLTSVADIRRLVQLGAVCRLEVGTGLKAFRLIAGVARLSVSKLTGVAHITVVLAFLADNARIVPSSLLQLDV